MKIILTAELRRIFERILTEDKSVNEWAEIESDDLFQTEQYVGGFDATEKAFCFSYYDNSGTEYWFQLDSEDIPKFLNGNRDHIDCRLAPN